ncbi:MAG: PP2C family protein-serine/threonine phosphatase [Phycisphaerales bacterium]
MAEPVLTLVYSPDAEADARRRMAAILARWPTGEPKPRVTEIPLDRLMEAAEESSDAPVESAALFVVVDAGVPAVVTYKLVDRLQRWALPAVVLPGTASPEMLRLQSGGVVVRPADTDPAFLAAVLFALAERQPVVQSLSRDVRIANRYSGGVRGEIDRIHDELNLAAAVQQEMLPRALPEVEGLEFSVIFRPVGYVSGDIYDAAALDDTRIGFLIADAVGHGVPAALMTMVISRALRTIRAEEGSALSPGEVLTRLNADLLKSRRQSPRFGTAIYGVIDTATMRVQVAAAGHPFPLLVRRDGKVETIQADGALLGVFPDEVYADATFTLGPDETLLLYSDGVETAFANPLVERLGPRRQKTAEPPHVTQLRAIRWPNTGSGVALADSMAELGRLIDLQAGSLHQADDITTVAVRRLAKVESNVARAA